MERVVQKIESCNSGKPHRLRVAAYGRVSCEKDSMHHSMAAQISYYSRLIQSHKDWVFCGVYSDEAITGTKDSRDAFQRLLNDCRAGKIDMVLTKAVSRFARNTVTTLETVRELKSLGVDVFFEEQSIHSMGSDGELLLTLLASFAQEESRSASENVKWRIRHGFENGELMTLRYLYGYNITKGSVEINEAEASIVREVFSRIIGGESLTAVARDLEERKVQRTFGGHWSNRALKEMVTNEKYTGNAILQKTYVNNHLEKKTVKNNGELRKYYAEGTHPAIISREVFEAAQKTLAAIQEKTSCRTPLERTAFSGMIVCGNCGCHYIRITVLGKKYYQCKTYFTKGKRFCYAKRIPESVLYKESADVLGGGPFNEDQFCKQIERITVPAPNRLIFTFRDGHTEERRWEDNSRANSWTPEMKEKARQRSLEQHRRNL